MPLLNTILWAAAVGLSGSLGLVAAARAWALRRMVLDHPNERSLHRRPTPRGGGIGIVVPTCVALAVLGALMPQARTAAGCLVMAGLVVAGVGLTDDILGLSAAKRMLAHITAAAGVIVVIGVCREVAVPGLSTVELGWVALPFTAVWLVGVTNIYNFMDGVDGIAGSQGTVAGFGWVGAGIAIQDPLVTGVGAVVAFASLGFLVFNWPPASIFMGDVGSSFLGFVFAALVVYVAPRSPAASTAGILFLWPFLFDAAFTLARRVSRRENLLHAHRTHLYQRLVLSGVSHRAVTLLYAVLAAVGVTLGIGVAGGSRAASILAIPLIAVLAAGLWLGVSRRERAVRQHLVHYQPSSRR